MGGALVACLGISIEASLFGIAGPFVGFNALETRSLAPFRTMIAPYKGCLPQVAAVAQRAWREWRGVAARGRDHVPEALLEEAAGRTCRARVRSRRPAAIVATLRRLGSAPRPLATHRYKGYGGGVWGLSLLLAG